MCLVAGQSLCKLKDNGSGGRQRGRRGVKGGKGGVRDVKGGVGVGGHGLGPFRIGVKAQKEI